MIVFYFRLPDRTLEVSSMNRIFQRARSLRKKQVIMNNRMRRDITCPRQRAEILLPVSTGIDSLPVCTDITNYDDAQIRANPLLQFDREP